MATGGPHGVSDGVGYRGVDRRGGPPPAPGSPFDGLHLAAVVAIAATALALLAAGLWLDGAGEPDDALDLLLGAGAAAAALAAAALAGLRWRVAGSAPALWVSMAMLSSASHLGAFHLVPQISDHPVLGEAGAALAVAALALVAAGARSPEVDARIRPLPLLVVAAAGVVAVTAVLAVSGVDVAPPPAHPADGWPDVGWAGLWLVVAAIATWRAARRGGATFAAAGLLALSLALHWGVSGTLGLLDRLAPDGQLVLPLFGATLAALSAGKDLQATFAEQRSELLRSKVSATELEARAHAARLVAEERLHEARNALAAIDGATRILERHHDRLPPEERTALAAAVGAEVARLQLLIAADVGEEQRATFDVAEALAPALTGARALGLAVEAVLPPGLTGYGSWSAVAGVVQNLLENVRRHAVSSPALVTAGLQGDRLVVSVADRGPGLPPGQEEEIFGRGARGPASTGVPGTGLGLDIARRTVRRQGGDLRYEPRPGGGAVFVIELPATPAALGLEERPDSPSGAGSH